MTEPGLDPQDLPGPAIHTGAKNTGTMNSCSGKIGQRGAEVPEYPAAIECATATSGHPWLACQAR